MIYDLIDEMLGAILIAIIAVCVVMLIALLMFWLTGGDYVHYYSHCRWGFHTWGAKVVHHEWGWRCWGSE